jgi:hypothetical protein
MILQNLLLLPVKKETRLKELSNQDKHLLSNRRCNSKQNTHDIWEDNFESGLLDTN